MMQIIFSPQGIGSVGLVLDIVGAVLLFRYGLPSSAATQTRVYGDVASEVRQKYDRMGRWGLLLLITGFVLQLVGTLLQIPAIDALLQPAVGDDEG